MHQKGKDAAYKGCYYPLGPQLADLQKKGYTPEDAEKYIAGFQAFRGTDAQQEQRLMDTALKADKKFGRLTTDRNELAKRYKNWDSKLLDIYISQVPTYKPTTPDTEQVMRQKANILIKNVKASIALGCIVKFGHLKTKYEIDKKENKILQKQLIALLVSSPANEPSTYFLNRYKKKSAAKNKPDPATLNTCPEYTIFLEKYLHLLNQIADYADDPDVYVKFTQLKNHVQQEYSLQKKEKKLEQKANIQFQSATPLTPEKPGVHEIQQDIKTPSYEIVEEKIIPQPTTKKLRKDNFDPLAKVQADYQALKGKELSMADCLFNFAFSLSDFITHHCQLLENERMQYLVYLYCTIIQLRDKYKTPDDKNKTQNLANEVISAVQSNIAQKNLSYYSAGSTYRHLPSWYMESHKRIERVEKALNDFRPIIEKKGSEPTKNLDILLQLGLHTKQYLEKLSSTTHKKYDTLGDKSKGIDEDDNLVTNDTKQAICEVLGAMMAAVDKVLHNITNNQLGKIFCAFRPPTHHATHDHALGFCLVNTVIAAAIRLMKNGFKVMIVDFDIHHGDGNYEQLKKIHDEYAHLYRLIDVYIEAKYSPFIQNQPKAAEAKFSNNISLNEMKKNFSGEDLLNKIKKAVQKFNFEPDVVLVCAGFDGLSNEGFSGGLIPQNYYEIGAYLASLSKQMISFLEGGYQEDLAQSTVYYCLGTGGLLPKNLPSRVNNATLEQISQMLEGVYDQVRGNGVRLNI